jgi:pimeloyl-ACP methyl ester carboxylesterase
VGHVTSSSSKSGFAEVDRGRLFFEVAGNGSPVVLIHSGITDSRSWDPQVAALAEGHRVLRYDLRGLGQSDLGHGSYSNVDDLVMLLDAVGFERAALVGVSMGGALALDVALQHPGRVSALVLVGAGISGREPPDSFKAQMDEVDALFERGLIDQVVERELEIWLYGKGRTANDVDPVIRKAVGEMDRSNGLRFPADAKPEPIEPPAIGRLAEVQVPTLVIVGDLDVDHVQEGARVLTNGIRGARLAVMNGVAHVPNMERPVEFNRLVIDFLNERARSSVT